MKFMWSIKIHKAHGAYEILGVPEVHEVPRVYKILEVSRTTLGFMKGAVLLKNSLCWYNLRKRTCYS